MNDAHGTIISERRLALDGWRDMGAGVDLEPEDAIDVVLGTEDGDRDEDEHPTAEQLAGVDWLVRHHRQLMDEVVLEAALRLYKAYRMDMADGDDDFLPERRTPDEMRPHVLATQIHLTTLAGVDVPYVGIRLATYWDGEHDLGILCRGMELVDVAGDQHIDAHSARTLEGLRANGRSGGTLLDEDGYEI
jgi:hypothetical protein